jgi:hypothetical protein
MADGHGIDEGDSDGYWECKQFCFTDENGPSHIVDIVI